MRIYLGENSRPLFGVDSLVFEEHGIEFGDWNDNRKASIQVPISDVTVFMRGVAELKNVQHNGSFYAHIFLTKSGAEHNPSSPAYNSENSFHQSKRTGLLVLH